jgi:hypothetical protein
VSTDVEAHLESPGARTGILDTALFQARSSPDLPSTNEHATHHQPGKLHDAVQSPQEPRGPFCQSCAMPLESPTDFGTDFVGYRVSDFCRYCFADGALTDPQVPMPQMIERCVAIMSERGIMPAARAQALLDDVMASTQALSPACGCQLGHPREDRAPQARMRSPQCRCRPWDHAH